MYLYEHKLKTQKPQQMIKITNSVREDLQKSGIKAVSYTHLYSALYKRPIFAEDCRAWVHGPVYPEVYELFRDFKYNPIDDARFALLEGTVDALTDDEKRVIGLVVNTFGMYGGKAVSYTHRDV